MGNGYAHFSGDAGGGYARPVHPHVEFPADFIPLPEPLSGWTDRSLGYVGDARFVMFRYEPRGEEVVWNDGETYGFGAGGWCDFLDRVAPLADRSGVNLGLGWGGPTPATAVLVLDRHSGAAYFASRRSAEQFLTRPPGQQAAPATTQF